jgi:DNA-binding MarR family transcriptional regulator
MVRRYPADSRFIIHRDTIYKYDRTFYMEKTLALSDYQALAELRYQVRLFLRFSEEAARKMDLEPQQHQLMLAMKGLPTGMHPTVGALAERMQIQHHSAVELANRLASAGLVRRSRAGEDRRQVLLGLTLKGEKVLRELSVGHKAELRGQGPALVAALERAMRPTKGTHGSAPGRTFQAIRRGRLA